MGFPDSDYLNAIKTFYIGDDALIKFDYSPVEEGKSLKLDDSVSALNLDNASLNALKKNEITYVGQLVELNSGALLKLPGVGRVTLRAVKKELKDVGYSLGTNINYVKPDDRKVILLG